MKLKSRLILWRVALLMALAPGLSAQAKPPVSYAGGDGSSEKKAVIIKAHNEETGVHAEYTYLNKLYPGNERGQQGVFHHGKRSYDRLDFTTAKGEKKTIYFDITSFYGRLD